MAKGPSSSDMNRLVLVQRLKANLTPDASGRIDETNDANWETCGKQYVQFVTSGSREFLVGDQLNMQITHQITMRWSTKAAQYTTTMRLDYNGRKFNIAGPTQNVDEKNMWLRFPAAETPGTQQS